MAAAPCGAQRAPPLTIVSNAVVIGSSIGSPSLPERQSMAMHRDASILIDRVIANLGMRVENLPLNLRSERQIAICARNASRKAQIAVGCISARDIAARSAEIRRATEGTHTRGSGPCEKERRHVAAEHQRDH